MEQQSGCLLFSKFIVSLLCTILFLAAATPSAMADKKKKEFDHFMTGFPLSGAHLRAACESCHFKGVFRGTPSKCVSCHTGKNAPAKNARHIPSDNNCDNCHTTFNWKTKAVDHESVKGDCMACHTLPKDEMHTTYAQTIKCSNCHGTLKWSRAIFDHSSIDTSQCSRCHTQKPANHIPTNQDCGACHFSTRSWGKVGRYDHADAAGRCTLCHNNVQRGVIPHNFTQSECDFCHMSTNTWSNAQMNHVAASAVCSACHTADKPNDSIHANLANECSLCHTTESWDSAGVDHTDISGNCVRCHNGNDATGKPGTHINADNVCEACHSTNSWVVVKVDHAFVIGTCISCHINLKPNTPMHNHNLSCNACHSTITWTTTTFDHATTTLACDNCHAKPGAHFVSSIANCDGCHRNTAWSAVRHTHISADYPGGTKHANLACTACHGNPGNEATAWQNITYKPDCAGCHANQYRAGPHTKAIDTGVNYTVTELRDCAGACHIYANEAAANAGDPAQIVTTRNTHHSASGRGF